MLWDPFDQRFRDTERLRRRMNRLFEPMWQSEVHTAPSYPALNVWTNSEGAVVTAELPGMNLEGLDISVRENTLTLSGNREAEQLTEGQSYHRRERGFGKFHRTLQLPFSVESGKVEASYEKGVLRISLPRAEADKPRKITVRTI